MAKRTNTNAPTDLTMQQAADLLNVSRNYLMRLLDSNAIPHSRVGRQRRVPTDALLAFKAKRDMERRAKLDGLTRLSEDLGGYSESR